MNTTINERKLDFIDIIREGLKISFFKFKDFALLAIASFVPTSLMMITLIEVFPSEDTTINVIKLLLVFFLLLVQVIVNLIVSMSIAVITEKVVDDKPISVIEAVKCATSKWGSAFITSLLVIVIILGLTLLFVIPGIIYEIYYVFTLPVVALRDKYGKEALNYSKMLVEGQWWRVFGILLGIGIIFIIVNGAITYPLNKVSANPYFAIVPSAVSVFLSTVFGVMNVVLFLNNDFVYHRRLAKDKEMERARRMKRTLSTEEQIQTARIGRTVSAKLPPSEKVAHKSKTGKKANVVKRSTAKKSVKTSQRKTAS